MENKIAILIPTSNQIGFDTFKDSYQTLIVSNQMNIEEILIEVHKISKSAKIETLTFTTILTA